ncbi:HK97 gp10 family phage protein [Bifidobacterium sp. ESL0775]|uniref:HK97 gp10 family phage protein n=1 Tax=Bifidobacterium sp. ESL0775 TaxID=2983230 RepID=UPI0023F8CE96|nr:HK97 gp10 family phage protein [Bifidobacterium sp. ESL0775]WEV68720.1 HK97 gp10 family phage protein [Bifidobacterium sp. ESL0775]
MPAKGQTTVEFNDKFFDEIMKSAKVDSLCKQKAEAVLAQAQATAPVGDPNDPAYSDPEKHPGRPGDYRRGLQIKKVAHAHRNTYMVVGTDAKTMFVESRTGNLARALKAAK